MTPTPPVKENNKSPYDRDYFSIQDRPSAACFEFSKKLQYLQSFHAFPSFCYALVQLNKYLIL